MGTATGDRKKVALWTVAHRVTLGLLSSLCGQVSS
jgi:hypothetical protein